MAGADVVEIRPVENLRICPGCLVANSANDAFCTACGERLPVPPTTEDDGDCATPATVAADDAADAPTEIGAEPTMELQAWPSAAHEPHYRVAPSPVHAPPSPVPTPQRRRRRSQIAVSVAALVAVAIAATFGALWQVERQHADRLSTRLDTTRAQLDSTRRNLTQTEARLAATTSLSKKRRAVLLKAQDVLGKVDPLLSSVDGVQARAGDLQAQGNTLSGDAEALIQTTITLVDYLVQTDANYVDYTYVNNLIDQANANLRSVRADEFLFGSDDAKYNAASAAFGHRADAFSAAVRGLQKQLKGVAAP